MWKSLLRYDDELSFPYSGTAAKLAPAVVALEGDEQQVQDLIQAELEEALETLSHAEEALAEPDDGANEEAEEKDTG